MLPFLVRRLAWLGFVLFGVVTIVFFLIHLIPGDPVEVMLGDQALATDKAALRAALGLDRPLLAQYGSYLLGVVQGDLGMSLFSKQPVLAAIGVRLPATLELMLGGMVIALMISVPLGVVAALRPRTVVDAGAMFVSLLGISIPNFWLGPMLIIVFSLWLGWLPVNERGGMEHLILPAITLGTALAAMLSRMIRSSLLEVLGEDYVRTARAKGLAERVVIMKHAFRNALLPVVTIIGLQIGALLSGAIITESIFDWPGIGSLLLDGIYTRDYPIVQGCILVIAMGYVVVNTLVDISYGVIDPRVRITD